ncbi:MAG TPA: helix-turn-helix transcriptional regulator [Mycobacteriales bacterium]|nr:helix-turn-helix transcriptional regulator [Mycobacteriales bacterium]
MDGGTAEDRREAGRREFAAFLRARRERLDPAELGLPSVGQRRTPGLRREEVAQLAGVSVDYYVRLEQGRDLRPSAAVLDALAGALQLAASERDHLFRLGRTPPEPRRSTPGVERVRPVTRRLLELVYPAPAAIYGRRLDLLAWNRGFSALIIDPALLPAGRRNMVLLMFLDPGIRELYAHWSTHARDVVAALRAAAGRHPDDPSISTLVGELSIKSAEFRSLWSRHDVREKTAGRKEFDHPLVGRIALDYEMLAVPNSDQALQVYSAAPDSPDEAALRLLTSLHAGPAHARPAQAGPTHAGPAQAGAAQA